MKKNDPLKDYKAVEKAACGKPPNYRVYLGLDEVRAAQAADREGGPPPVQRPTRAAREPKSLGPPKPTKPKKRPQWRHWSEARVQAILDSTESARITAERHGCYLGTVYDIWRRHGRPASTNRGAMRR